MVSFTKILATFGLSPPKIPLTLLIASPASRPRMARATRISRRVNAWRAEFPWRLDGAQGAVEDKVKEDMGGGIGRELRMRQLKTQTRKKDVSAGRIASGCQVATPNETPSRRPIPARPHLRRPHTSRYFIAWRGRRGK